MEAYFTKALHAKVNKLEHCGDHDDDCPCSGGGVNAKPKVDLIVLIDTSGSMTSYATSVSDAAREAIDKVKSKCASDLKTTYLGVDGKWVGTVFTTSHRDYITGVQGAPVPLAADVPPVGSLQDQGANAVQDLSKYADWRKGACRAIFYISDEELDSVSPRGNIAQEAAATLAAINEANQNNVTVFAHHLTYQHSNPLGAWANVIQNYTDLCTKTGGKAFFSNTADKAKYIELLEEVICNACGGCRDAKLPNAAPCFSVAWGDSDCDCLETNDFEVLSVTACNCYSNIAFENLMVGSIVVTDAFGNPVPLLPDGSPSVEVHPPGALCFGTLGPCIDNKTTCKTREIVIYTRGAKAGKYSLHFEAVCYSISYTAQTKECFSFNLCKD